jgi:formylglycine-generating enzyme required for sulfatase activity/serine/threonine protein kinase
MAPAPSGHPPEHVLTAYALGKLDDSSAKAVSQHLGRCVACRKRVAELPADSFVDRIRQAQARDRPVVEQSQEHCSQILGATDADIPPPSNTLPPGLADHPDYEIRRELGRGGMGVVYLAHNQLMGRDEVLKVIGQKITERAEVLERFLREIRAVARLRHPNIVTAYHATRIGANLVFAMEYVEGLDLARMVKANGPLPVSHACYYVHQAAIGLQHAHEEGLIHRDIKPGNLMLAQRKDKVAIKILDFGLAKASREGKIDNQLTSEGQTLGTPDYIAPEQITDATHADIRADIYSLGGTLYHLLCGRPPFQAGSLYDLYQAHMSRDADPPNFVRPEVPVELGSLVAKMMAKDPARRFQTPGEVAQALIPFFRRGAVADFAAGAELSRVKFPRDESGDNAFGGRSPEQQPVQGYPSASMRSIERPSQKPQAELEGRAAPQKEEQPTQTAIPAATRRGRRRWVVPGIIAGSMSCILALGLIIAGVRHNRRLDTLHGTTTDRLVASTDGWAGAHPGDVKVVRFSDVEVRFRWCPAGSFTMGSDPSEPYRAPDEDQASVTLTHGFWLQETEVTQALWKVVLSGITPAPPSERGWNAKPDWNEKGTAADLPAYNVTHPQAVKFCELVSDRLRGTGQLPNGMAVVLPSEAQWEYAARAGTPTRFSFGDDEGLVGDHAWCVANSGDKPHPVAGREPNPWGLHDMAGNVWEWCADHASATLIGGTDPLVFSGVSDSWISRGGAWNDGPGNCRPAFRGQRTPYRQPVHMGFRMAVVPASSLKPEPNTSAAADAGIARSEAKKVGDLRAIQDGSSDSVASVPAPRAPATAGSSPPRVSVAIVSPPAAPATAVSPPPTVAAKSAWGGTKAGEPRILRFADHAIRLRWCPPGSFKMGSPENEAGRDPDENQVDVTLTRGYWMLETEVTQELWLAVMGTKLDWSATREARNLPVYNVSYLDAERFCSGLTGRLHRADALPSDWAFGLPTEAQWEYAARAGSTSRYFFGDDEGRLGEYAWYAGNCGTPLPHEVGSKRANRWDLRDMLGNVWEWCADGHGLLKTGVDPRGSPSSPYRVLRGGSWLHEPGFCRSADRAKHEPDYRYIDVGFRVAAVQR